MLQRRPWEKQRNSFKHSSFKVDIKLSFHIEGTRTLKSKGLPGIPSLSLQHYLPTGWGHLVDLASVRGIHYYSPWSCCCCLEITFLRAPTDQMLWRASAYGLVSSLSRQDPSWPTHRHLWPRRSYRAVTLLHPFNFTSPITPVPIISHTGTDFCHLLPPALKTPMASSQLLYAYTAEGGLLLTQKLQSSSRLANPASFSALWGLIHIFKEVWALRVYSSLVTLLLP